jgi:hypothetical protein
MFHPQFQMGKPMENQHFQDENLWFSSFFIHRFFRSEHGKLTKIACFQRLTAWQEACPKQPIFAMGFSMGHWAAGCVAMNHGRV